MLNRAKEIGEANADAAFDFRSDYTSLENAIDSFFWNCQDTLIEEGILDDDTLHEAVTAFNNRIAVLKAS